MTTTVTPKPQVGDGVTVFYYSDREAGTIIKVSPSGKKIWVQEDTAIRTDNFGMSDSQSYRYERNPKGKVWEFTLRKNGRFVQVNQEMRGGTVAKVGVRSYYYDYSF